MSYCSSIVVKRMAVPTESASFLYPKSACRSLQSCQGSRNFSDVWLAHWSGSGGSSDGISVYALAALMCLVQTLDIPNCFTMFHILIHFTSFNDSQCLLRASRWTVEVTGLVYSTTRVLVGQRGSTTRHSTKTLRIPSTCWMCKFMLKRFHHFFKRPFLPTMNH